MSRYYGIISANKVVLAAKQEKYNSLISSLWNFGMENIKYMYIHKLNSITLLLILYCWLVRVSLFIELGGPKDLGTGWRGDLWTFMISRPI